MKPEEKAEWALIALSIPWLILKAYADAKCSDYEREQHLQRQIEFRREMDAYEEKYESQWNYYDEQDLTEGNGYDDNE